MQPCVKTSISTDKAKSGKTWAQVHETGQHNRINGLAFGGTDEVVKKKSTFCFKAVHSYTNRKNLKDACA